MASETMKCPECGEPACDEAMTLIVDRAKKVLDEFSYGFDVRCSSGHIWPVGRAECEALIA